VTRWKNAVASAATQRELKQDVLYREAAQAFRRNGYHGTSLEDVARALGISKPTLYHYVKNKGDLLFQVHMAGAAQALSTVCHDRTLSGIERLRRTTAAYVRSMIDDESYSVIILEEKSLRPEQLAIVVRERDKFEAELLSMVRDGMRDGSIVPGEPRFALFNVLGAVNWVTKWHRPRGDWSIDEIGDGIATFVCRALSPVPNRFVSGNRLLAPPVPDTIRS
jgi:TetR/AcrR family transcriptional regulator